MANEGWEIGDVSKRPNVLIGGYGKMGQLVHEVLKARKAQVVAIAEPNKEVVPPEFHNMWIPDVGRLEDGESEVTQPDNPGGVYATDTAICFTAHEWGYPTTKFLLSKGIDTVVGTTTWYLNGDGSVNNEMLGELEELAVKNKCRFVYAPNFSAGVVVLRKLAVEAAKLLVPLGYDIAVEERHHNEKGDASGTGGAICNDIIAADVGKTGIKTEGHKTPRLPGQITLSITRAGHIPGTHNVVYDGTYDTVEISHVVRDRAVFAEGAVNAALKAKGMPPGMYVLEQLVD